MTGAQQKGISDISLPFLFVLHMLIYFLHFFIIVDPARSNQRKFFADLLKKKTYSLSNLVSARSGDSSLSDSRIFNDLFGSGENVWKKEKET